MGKKFLTYISAFFTIFSGILGLTCCRTNDENSQYPQSDIYENVFSEEEQIIKMFENFASYEEGVYRFRKWNSVGDCNFSYSFSCKPEIKMYHCSVLVTTNGNYDMYDYGSVTFSWGDMKNALFCGYHELENIAIIEQEFANIKFNSNISLGNNYSYKVTKNTFVNLNKKEDIDEYASYIFDCIEGAIGYAQSILYEYTNGITLW